MTDQSIQCQFIQSIKHMRNSEQLISKASHLKFDFTKKRRKIFSKQKKIRSEFNINQTKKEGRGIFKATSFWSQLLKV